ncbi:Thioredoxin F1, chloroplastic [Linum grandiflorum]
MALIHLSTSAIHSNSFPSCSPVLSSVNKDHSLSFSGSPISSAGCSFSKRRSRRNDSLLTVKSSMETVATVGQVTEVSNDTFWPIVKSAGDKTVVLDMYTQWCLPLSIMCGPCKVMAPKYEELSKKYMDVVFLKLDCNAENRPLAKELGIRVVPTFKILKDNKVVKEVTGAKFDDLVLAIDTVRSS